MTKTGIDSEKIVLFRYLCNFSRSRSPVLNEIEDYEDIGEDYDQQLDPLLGKIIAEMGRRKEETAKRTAAYSQWRKNGKKRSSEEVGGEFASLIALNTTLILHEISRKYLWNFS